MESARRPLGAVLVAVLVLGPSSPAHAQLPRDAEQLSTWALGVSAGIWDLASQSRSEGTVNTAIDANVERRFSWLRNGGGRAVRVQVGRGTGGDPGGPGFDYRRVMVGLVRNLGYFDRVFSVHLAGGAGAHVLRPAADSYHAFVSEDVRLQDGRRTSPSAFWAAGWDAKLGSRRVTLRGEVQVYSIGSSLYGSWNLGVQMHFR